LKRGVAVDLSPDDVRVLRTITGLGDGRQARGKPRDNARAERAPQQGPREPRPPRETREPRQPRSHEAQVIVKKRRGGKHSLHEGFGDAALRAREHEFDDRDDDSQVESADFVNIPNPLQQTFDQRAIREERRPKRDVPDHDDDNNAAIPNPLQQTFDQRALKAARAPQRELDDDAPIPNPLQQTYDKRFNKGTPKGGTGAGAGNASARSRHKKRGGGGGAAKGSGGAQPDPMRTAVGYIGADAFLGKKGGGTGRRRGGGGGRSR
jgi:23S rRNA pseudouridine2605 synthase